MSRATTPEFPWEALRRANRDRERAARKAAGKRPCRTCGRLIMVDVRGTSSKVEIPNALGGIDLGERVDFAPTGGYGYHDTGICTLRCALAWADRRAPRVSP